MLWGFSRRMGSSSAHEPHQNRRTPQWPEGASLHKEAASEVRVCVSGGKEGKRKCPWERRGSVFGLNVKASLAKQNLTFVSFLSEWWLWRWEDSQSCSGTVLNKQTVTCCAANQPGTSIPSPWHCGAGAGKGFQIPSPLWQSTAAHHLSLLLECSFYSNINNYFS